MKKANEFKGRRFEPTFYVPNQWIWLYPISWCHYWHQKESMAVIYYRLCSVSCCVHCSFHLPFISRQMFHLEWAVSRCFYCNLSTGLWGVLQIITWLTLCLNESSILKPGGWLQLIEVYYMIQSDNGTITENNVLRQMSTNFFSAIEGTKDPRAPLRFDSMMREAGLVELGSRMIPIPLNGWPSG